MYIVFTENEGHLQCRFLNTPCTVPRFLFSLKEKVFTVDTAGPTTSLYGCVLCVYMYIELWMHAGGC